MCNSFDTLDDFTLHLIYDFMSLEGKFIFSATCRKYHELKRKITHLVVDTLMTDISTSGLTNVTHIDCDNNILLTNKCFQNMPNVTRMSFGCNVNFTHEIFDMLPNLSIIDLDKRIDDMNILIHPDKFVHMKLCYRPRGAIGNFYRCINDPSKIIQVCATYDMRFSTDLSHKIEWTKCMYSLSSELLTENSTFSMKINIDCLNDKILSKLKPSYHNDFTKSLNILKEKLSGQMVSPNFGFDDDDRDEESSDSDPDFFHDIDMEIEQDAMFQYGGENEFYDSDD